MPRTSYPRDKNAVKSFTGDIRLKPSHEATDNSQWREPRAISLEPFCELQKWHVKEFPLRERTNYHLSLGRG